jgi:hypothetical protein
MKRIVVASAVCLFAICIAVVASGVKTGPEYDLRCGAISSGGFAVLKFDINSGQSWVAIQTNEWKQVTEPSKPSGGTYDVHVEQYATKDMSGKDTTEWQMFRINKTTGEAWVLMSRGDMGKQESRWQEIADAK